jgi:sec-independent protein translocase protein TatA
MALETVPLFVPGGPGPLELGILLLIAVLLFGANKIPKLARSTGEAMGEFQKGREEVEQELEEMREGVSTDSTTSDTDTTTSTSTDTETETATESTSTSDSTTSE